MRARHALQTRRPPERLAHRGARIRERALCRREVACGAVVARAVVEGSDERGARGAEAAPVRGRALRGERGHLGDLDPEAGGRAGGGGGGELESCAAGGAGGRRRAAVAGATGERREDGGAGDGVLVDVAVLVCAGEGDGGELARCGARGASANRELAAEPKKVSISRGLADWKVG